MNENTPKMGKEIIIENDRERHFSHTDLNRYFPSNLDVLRGNMLGDGSIQLNNHVKNGIVKENARYCMTMSTPFMKYIEFLQNHIYSPFYPSKLYPISLS